jgi:uncharacterized protein YkwD
VAAAKNTTSRQSAYSKISQKSLTEKSKKIALDSVIKSLALSISIVILAYPGIGIISIHQINLSLHSIFTPAFLFDLLVVLIISVIYDYAVEYSGPHFGDYLGVLIATSILNSTAAPESFDLAYAIVLFLLLFLPLVLSMFIGNLAMENRTSKKIIRFCVGIAIVAVLLIEISYLYEFFAGYGNYTNVISQILPNSTLVTSSVYPGFNQSLNSSTTYVNVTQNSTMTENSLVQYALSLINSNRKEYGLGNVTLSTEPSAQQHADSMLNYGYFSHWDIYGMKPYMRYTLLGGTEGVEENIAYQESSIEKCLGPICKTYGDINVKQALYDMEYNMMYNDSKCCNNGHRDNILNPFHTQVSIGIAYNSSTVYFVEDFINDYVSWSAGTPGVSNGNVYLYGNITNGYSLSSIEVTYDSPVKNMSISELDNTSSYSYGTPIAGVVSSNSYYYPNLTTIVANQYHTAGQQFKISFSLSKTISQYGAGEYTTLVWLKAANGTDFIGSSYTAFINSNGNAYTPKNV